MIGFVFPNPFYVFLGPKANLHAPQSVRRRCFDPFLANPAMECARSNLKKPRDLNRRIGLHGYNGVPYTICQAQNRTAGADSESSECAAMKSISVSLENRSR